MNSDKLAQKRAELRTYYQKQDALKVETFRAALSRAMCWEFFECALGRTFPDWTIRSTFHEESWSSSDDQRRIERMGRIFDFLKDIDDASECENPWRALSFANRLEALFETPSEALGEWNVAKRKSFLQRDEFVLVASVEPPSKYDLVIYDSEWWDAAEEPFSPPFFEDWIHETEVGCELGPILKAMEVWAEDRWAEYMVLREEGPSRRRGCSLEEDE